MSLKGEKAESGSEMAARVGGAFMGLKKAPVKTGCWFRFLRYLNEHDALQHLLVHFIMWLFLLLYVVFAAMIMNSIEGNDEQDQPIKGVSVGVTELPQSDLLINQTACLMEPEKKWNFQNALRFVFGIITTTGSSQEVNTETGMIVAMVIGTIGIPLSMLTLADIGSFIMDASVFLLTSIAHKKEKILPGQGESKSPTSKEKTDKTSLRRIIQLGFFLVFLAITASLHLFKNSRHTTERIFFSFVMVSSLGFGDISSCVDLCPGRTAFVLAYSTIGIILMTMSIEAAAEVFKRINYLGAKLKNVANMSIWVGGKKMSIAQMLHPISKKYGIDMDDLVDLVKLAAEGREPDNPITVDDLKKFFNLDEGSFDEIDEEDSIDLV